MSLKFAQTDIMSEEEHDCEVQNPSESNRLRPSVLFPGTIAGSSSIRNESTTNQSESVSSHAKWHKRRKWDDVNALKYRLKMKHMEAVRLNRQTTFTVGGQVVTSDPRIAPLEDVIRPGKKEKLPAPTHGKIIKQSDYFPNFWLVEFYGIQKRYYVTEKVVKFISKVNQDLYFKGSYQNQSVMNKIDKKVKEDKEVVLTQILNSKVQTLPDANLCTYEGVCQLFKPHYFWLSPNILKNHAYVLRQKSGNIQKGTWLHELPEPYPELGKAQSTKKSPDKKASTAESPSKYFIFFYY